MKKPLIYKDENIEIKINKDMDILDMPLVAMSCIEAWLIWYKTYYKQAKKPIELWKLCRSSIDATIDIMEDILYKTEADAPKE